MSDRVSLAGLSSGGSPNFRRASSDKLSAHAAPTVQDLAEQLFFSPGDGRIWLNDQRMMLLHSSSFGALRRELIETLGSERARELLTRVGYGSGARDAELVRRRWPQGDPASALAGGPNLHALEGAAKTTTVKFDFDVDRGSFYGEFLWEDSMEAAEHIAAYGVSPSPVCWMQIGYACGYSSAFMGKLVVYRETECRATGAPCCRIVGQPADMWPNSEDDRKYFKVDVAPEPHASFRAEGRTEPRVKPSYADDQAMLGMSPAFRAARHMLERVAPTDATVLLKGETGVGKELFARALHQTSPRASKPFVSVNCAAIPDTLVEADLFGVERGAYTGAASSRAGRFERASGGTLFLDEIESLSLVAQGKLLRVLQEGEIERVGGTKTIKVDVRVVAAGNRDLEAECAVGRFRADLFFRLDVFPIGLPPLRERRDDIPLLLDHFLAMFSAKYDRKITGFTSRAIEAMLNFEFPGNIRQLRNLVERGVIFAEVGGAIDTIHLFRRGEMHHGGAFSLDGRGALREIVQEPVESKSEGNPRSLEAPRETATSATTFAAAILDANLDAKTLEKQICAEALARAGGNVSAAARRIGISRAQLEYRLKKYAGE